MRRAYHDAMTVARNRVVFGNRIIDLPLARRQMLKIMLPVEQALSMSFSPPTRSTAPRRAARMRRHCCAS